MEKERNTINKLVGFRDNELYRLESTFEHDKDFKGATGSVFELLTQAMLDERNEDEYWKDYCREIWQELAHNGNTEESLEDFTELVRNEYDGEFAGHDPSYCYEDDTKLEIVNKHYKAYCEKEGIDYEEIVCLNCVGGGRCFNKNDEYDYVIDQSAIDEINKYEK